ncbi:MAG: hypothetical protein H0Z18_09135 [Thermococcus sp.]|nr:hypothetical protein [Thermococcus sp.]MBO8175407.1 hypothetical protein [Thermococcus sp.]
MKEAVFEMCLDVVKLNQLKRALEREEHPLVRQIIRDKIEELEKGVKR